MNRSFLKVAVFATTALVFAVSTAFAAMPTTKPYHQSIKDCSVCHTAENAVAGNAFVVPSDKTCQGCHGTYKDLAAKTANLGEPNPHASHHYGEGIACTACHKEHQKSEVYCSQCHPFKYSIK